jgi:hypothetical protein
MNFVLCSLFYFVSIKILFAKNRVLSVCKLIILKVYCSGESKDRKSLGH